MPRPATPAVRRDVRSDQVGGAGVRAVTGLDVVRSGSAVAFAGEVDMATHAAYASALAAAVTAGLDDVRVDLDRVRFLDGRAADIRLDVAERLSAADRRLVLVGAPRVLRCILDVLDDPRSRHLRTLPAADSVRHRGVTDEAGA